MIRVDYSKNDFVNGVWHPVSLAIEFGQERRDIVSRVHDSITTTGAFARHAEAAGRLVVAGGLMNMHVDSGAAARLATAPQIFATERTFQGNFDAAAPIQSVLDEDPKADGRHSIDVISAVMDKHEIVQLGVNLVALAARLDRFGRNGHSHIRNQSTSVGITRTRFYPLAHEASLAARSYEQWGLGLEEQEAVSVSQPSTDGHLVYENVMGVDIKQDTVSVTYTGSATEVYSNGGAVTAVGRGRFPLAGIAGRTGILLPS